MTITDIDKQFDEKFIVKGKYDDGGRWEDFAEETESFEVREFIHQIYSQAKAEQREEDARITEGMNVGEEAGFVLSLPKFVKRDNEMFNGGYNRAVADIAKAIRSQS